MKLELKKREKSTKSAFKMIKREGNIPGIVYQSGKDSLPITVEGRAFLQHLRHMNRGCIATTRFSCTLDGKKFSAILKDISYHRTTYDVLHMDLYPIDDSMTIRVNVPVLAEDADSCPGISQGGQLKLVKRSIPVSIKAKHLPEAFKMSVSTLNLGDSLRVRDLPKIETMKVLMAEHQVLMTVNK